MKRFVPVLLVLASLCFGQQGLRVIGNVPRASDAGLYHVQVGAFAIRHNAERAATKLVEFSLVPVFESVRGPSGQELTRVMVAVSAGEVPRILETLRGAGFREAVVRPAPPPESAPPPAPRAEPPAERPAVRAERFADIPISGARLPPRTRTEIGYRTVKIGETISLADLAEGRTVAAWTGNSPAFKVSPSGEITGLALGNGFVGINDSEYIAVAVVPAEEFYTVAEAEVAMLPDDSRTGSNGSSDIVEYRTEPTFRLAYRFNNKGEYKGMSGENGGIDILGRGENYLWLWTTYEQGGWFYDLNGRKREMVEGYQKDERSGVELRVKPEFVYDRGVPYLQLRHVLKNTGTETASGQRFGASADVMIHNNDSATLKRTPYGAYMTDSATNPSLELMFICTEGGGINPVDTLWLGTWSGGYHLDHIYESREDDVAGRDSAIGFSYQNISLEPGEEKEFIVRFTLARTED